MEGRSSHHENREAIHYLLTLLQERCDASWGPELHASAPCLMKLAEESGDEPTHQLRLRVHMILYDHCVGSRPDPHALSRQVGRVVEALRQYRRDRHGGDAPRTPVPPLMCG